MRRPLAAGTLVVTLIVLGGCGGGDLIVAPTTRAPVSPTPPASTAVQRTTATPTETTALPGSSGSRTTVPDTSSPAPTTTLTPPASGADFVWLGGHGCGVTLLDPAGQWWPFREGSGPLASDDVADLVVDGSGVAWIATGDTLYRVTGGAWESVPTDASPGSLALDPASGDLWVASYDSVSAFDGSSWTVHPMSEFGLSEPGSVQDVTVDPQGSVWVALSAGVARYDGSTWTSWEAGAGLPTDTDTPYFESIAAGPDGRIWLADDNRVYVSDGSKWTTVSDPRVTQLDQLAVSADGRVWVTTYADGLAVLVGDRWQVVNRQNSGLPTDRVRSVAVDGQGRLWVGTVWGVAVRDGDQWTTYSMATSGLGGNCVDAIAMSGAGPPLPAVSPTRVGSATGVIADGATPLANRTIVLCSESASFFFTGDHPCAGQPVAVVTTTDAEGRFRFDDVPVGEGYELAWIGLDDGWHSYLIGGETIDIEEGRMTEIPPIDVSED